MAQRRDHLMDARAPLALVFVGLPVWWVLGLAALIPLAVAGLLAVRLLHSKQPLHLPVGAGLWLLFVVWVALGAFLIGVDAPGAAPGGDGVGRAMVFGYRLGWYLTCTVFLLWLGNTSRRELPDRTVHALVAVAFAIGTLGGLLGLWLPHLEFTSLTEALLPGGLRSNNFVLSLVHPQTADVQSVLGRPEARPKAPFPFTNTWGSVMALSAVFAAAWAFRGTKADRLLVGAIGSIALIPVVFSLNRGLWACVALGVLGAVLLTLRAGHARALVGSAIAITLVLMLAAGPLLTLVSERFDNQHSNDRRGQLASATMDSVTEGSPLMGFGTTRDVQGSFASISGGSTPDCPACGVPPLGTQGHFWLVLFSQGWVGVALFIGFLARWLARSWRCRTVNETLATFVLVFFGVQIFMYDTLGLPLLVVFVAIGLVWREQREDQGRGKAWTVPALGRRLRQGAPVAVTLVCLGAAGGWAMGQLNQKPTWRTEIQMVLTNPPDPYSPAVIGDVLGDRLQPSRELQITIDTEAAILLSEETLSTVVNDLSHGGLSDSAGATDGGEQAGAAAVRGTEKVSTQTLRDNVRLSAVPTTHILVLDVTGPSAKASKERGLAIAQTYLTARQRYVDERRSDLLARVSTDLRRLLPDRTTTADLVLRLNSADRKLRTGSVTVGRVVNVSKPAAVAQGVGVLTVSGAGLGLLAGVAIGMLRGPAARRRALRAGSARIAKRGTP